MTSEQALQYALSGITVGGIYAIVAIGFNIIYSTTGVINFAQGEFVVIGAMTAISLTAVMPMPLAILIAVAITAVVGALVEILFIKWIRGASIQRLVIITIAVSILLQSAVRHIWDEKVRAMPFFSGNEVSSISFLGGHFSPQVLWVLGTCSLIVICLSLFFKFTLTGQAMRSCAANPTAARLCGINVSRLVTVSFMLSAAIGALAGCVTSPLTQTQFDMGPGFAIKGFTAAILGGLGNNTAAVSAGLILGLLEAFSISIFPLAYQDVICVAILLIILFFRPTGLFGKPAPGGH